MRLGRSDWIAAALVFALWAPGFGEELDPLVLSPEEAVAYAVERNLLVQSARLGRDVAARAVDVANTAWTPQLVGRTGGASQQTPPLTAFDQGRRAIVNRNVSSSLGVGQLLPWGGSYSIDWDASRLSGNSAVTLFNPQVGSNASLTLTQPLLRGLFIDERRANRLIALRRRDISDADLTSAIAATTNSVRRAYWLWIYAQEFLAVEKESLILAQNLLRDNRQRVARGAMAAVDVVEAEAEVARRSDVIVSATREVANAEDQLRLLMFAPGDPELQRPLAPPSLPRRDSMVITDPPAEVMARAMENRQDLRVLRVVLDIDDITVRRFHNEALPDVSLQLGYAARGLAGSELVRAQGITGPVTGTVDRGFGSAVGDLVRFRYPGWSAELSFSYPLGRSRAEAESAKAQVQRRQDETLLRRAEQQVATEVRVALRGVASNQERLPLTATAVELAERRLDAEQRKFLVGLSTSFLVFQAQRDLTVARERRAATILEYRLALADLEAVERIPVRR